MSPIDARSVYDTFIKMFGWLEDIWYYIRAPLDDVVVLDFQSDNVIVKGIVEIVQFVVDFVLEMEFIGVRVGEMNIMEFLFGAGFGFVLVITLVNWFRG